MFLAVLPYIHDPTHEQTFVTPFDFVEALKDAFWIS